MCKDLFEKYEKVKRKKVYKYKFTYTANNRWTHNYYNWEEEVSDLECKIEIIVLGYTLLIYKHWGL